MVDKIDLMWYNDRKKEKYVLGGESNKYDFI